MPHPCVYFVITGWKLDSFGGCTGFEQNAHGIGATAVGPIGLDAGLHGELERSAALGVNRVHRFAAGDQLFDNLGWGPPHSDVQRRAITSEIVISTTFKMGRVGVHPQVQEIADAREITISREFSEQGFRPVPRAAALVRHSGSQRVDGFCLIARTGGDQRINSGEVDVSRIARSRRRCRDGQRS
jgi:hypothetical protein